MSLGGLALATGLIVDDAVVILENIFRHFERGERNVIEAAVNATTEILPAVFASTWTVMVVFLPLFLIRGQAGQMFTQFALVVIFALAVSLLDAATVVPMLATRLLHGAAHEETEGTPQERQTLGARAFRRFGQWFRALDLRYRDALGWALQHRPWVIIGALVVTCLSLLLVPQIGTELLPQTDSGNFTINLRLPVGTALSETDAMMRRAEQIVVHHPDVETAFSAVGTNLTLRGTTTTLTPYQGALQVRLKDNRRESTLQVISDLRPRLARLPGVTPRLYQFDLVTNLMSGGNPTVETDIFGNNLSVLSRSAQDAMARERGIPGLQNLDVNWQEAQPEIRWAVDRGVAQQLGISYLDVANTLNTATNGSIASYYQEQGFQYPIIVQMPEGVRKTVPQLRDLLITPSVTVMPTLSATPNPPGAAATATVTTTTMAAQMPAMTTTTYTAPTASAAPTTAGAAGSATLPGDPPAILLRQIAQPNYGLGPSEITRLNRQRYIAVLGTPENRSIGEIQNDVQHALVGFTLPPRLLLGLGPHPKAPGRRVLQPQPRRRARHLPHLHAARRPVRIFYPPPHHPALRPPRRHRRHPRPLPHQPQLRPHCLHRPAHAGRDRGEERHPAGGLHQPAPPPGNGAQRSRPHRRPHPAPAHPDDRLRRHPRDAAPRARRWAGAARRKLPWPPPSSAG